MANETVELRTTDDTEIRGSARISRGNDGVILVHGHEQTSSNWDNTAIALHTRGITTLNIDLRGYGASRDESAETLTEADYQAMPLDILAAVEWMNEHDIERITCLGSGLGANLCLHAASRSEDIERVALLSPGFNYQGVTSAAEARTLGERDMLIIYSSEDAYSEQTSNFIAEHATGPVYIEARSGLGHGIRMLGRNPNLETTLVDWIDHHGTGNSTP